MIADAPAIWLPPAPAIIRPAEHSLLRPGGFPIVANRAEKRAILRELLKAGRISPADLALAGSVIVVAYPQSLPSVITFSSGDGKGSTADASAYSFTSVDLGPDDPSRVVVWMVYGVGGATNTSITSTIAGSAGTLIFLSRETGSSVCCATFARAVPTGDEVTIAATFSGGKTSASVIAISVYGGDVSAGLASWIADSDASPDFGVSSSTNLSISGLTCPPTGARLVLTSSGSSGAISWSGAAELFASIEATDQSLSIGVSEALSGIITGSQSGGSNRAVHGIGIAPA